MTSTLYVDLREPADYRERKTFGVPQDAQSRGEAWRIICPIEEHLEAVSIVGFARKRDAESAKLALEKVGCVDAVSLGKMPFEERVRIMLEALQW